MFKRLLLLGLLVLGVGTIWGCGSDGDATGTEAKGDESAELDRPIVIGAAIAKSGFIGPFDGPPFTGIQIAVDDINAAGGVLGQQIEVVSADTKSDRALGVRAAEQVLDQGADMVVASCDYDYGSPAALTAQRADKISFSTCTASVKWGVQGIGTYAYTPGTATVTEGYSNAEFAHNKMDWKKAFVLTDESATYNKEICGAFSKHFGEIGGTEVGSLTFKSDDASIASQINEIKRSDADFLQLCAQPPPGVTALRQIRAAGIDIPILSVDVMDGDYWMEATPDLSGFYYPSYAGSIFGDDPRQEVNDFLAKWKEKTGDDKPDNSYALMGYALVEMYVEAIKRAGTIDSAAVAAELDKFTDVDTLVGPTTFTDQVHVSMDRPYAYMQVENGKHKFVDYFGPETIPPFEIPNE